MTDAFIKHATGNGGGMSLEITFFLSLRTSLVLLELLPGLAELCMYVFLQETFEGVGVISLVGAIGISGVFCNNTLGKSA